MLEFMLLGAGIFLVSFTVAFVLGTWAHRR